MKILKECFTEFLSLFPTTVTIEVTKEDIEKGIKHDARSCPINLAMRRRVYAKMDVHKGYVNMESLTGRYYQAVLPETAVEFIQKFDSGVEVKPFRFQLKIKRRLRMAWIIWIG